MALTRREFAERLRTMNRSGSKAPLQNVQLPTNQGNYRTPGMTSTAPGVAEKKQQMNPQQMAAAGGLLGRIGKGAWDAFNRPESMALDKAGSANLAQIGGMMDLLTGSNVDVAANMASNTAGNLANLPQASLLGNGVPVGTPAGALAGAAKLGGAVPTGDWATTAGWAGNNAVGELGNLSTVSDAVKNATDAATTATEAAGNASNFNFPGVGTVAGMGLNAAQGNYGKAIGQGVGAGAGSFFGPAGTFLGGTLGGIFGGLFD